MPPMQSSWISLSILGSRIAAVVPAVEAVALIVIISMPIISMPLLLPPVLVIVLCLIFRGALVSSLCLQSVVWLCLVWMPACMSTGYSCVHKSFCFFVIGSLYVAFFLSWLVNECFCLSVFLLGRVGRIQSFGDLGIFQIGDSPIFPCFFLLFFSFVAPRANVFYVWSRVLFPGLNSLLPGFV